MSAEPLWPLACAVCEKPLPPDRLVTCCADPCYRKFVLTLPSEHRAGHEKRKIARRRPRRLGGRAGHK